MMIYVVRDGQVHSATITYNGAVKWEDEDSAPFYARDCRIRSKGESFYFSLFEGEHPEQGDRDEEIAVPGRLAEGEFVTHSLAEAEKEAREQVAPALMNLTPHTLNLLAGGGVAIPPSGTVARCDVTRHQLGVLLVDGTEVPINHTKFGVVTGLPDPRPGVYYIVSSLVAQAVPERADVLVVDDAVRDEAGRVIGARGLAHV